MIPSCSPRPQGLPGGAPYLQRFMAHIALQTDDGVDAGLVHQAILQGIPRSMEAASYSLTMDTVWQTMCDAVHGHHHTLDVVIQWRTTSPALRGQDPTVMLSSILSQLSVHRLYSQPGLVLTSIRTHQPSQDAAGRPGAGLQVTSVRWCHCHRRPPLIGAANTASLLTPLFIRCRLRLCGCRRACTETPGARPQAATAIHQYRVAAPRGNHAASCGRCWRRTLTWCRTAPQTTCPHRAPPHTMLGYCAAAARTQAEPRAPAGIAVCPPTLGEMVRWTPAPAASALLTRACCDPCAQGLDALAAAQRCPVNNRQGCLPLTWQM